MTRAPEVESVADELVLEPPKAVSSVTLDQAAATIKLARTAERIQSAVSSYGESLTNPSASRSSRRRRLDHAHGQERCAASEGRVACSTATLALRMARSPRSRSQAR